MADKQNGGEVSFFVFIIENLHAYLITGVAARIRVFF